jgi:hypothetical protein
MGGIFLEVSTDGGINWDAPIWSHTGVDIATGSPDVWNSQTVDIAAAGHTTGNMLVRFRAVMPAGGTIWNSDIGLDDVKFTTLGTPP